MQKVYITGSSIISALGSNKEDAVEHIRKIISDAYYKSYLKNNFQDRAFYSIKKEFSTQRERFYSLIKQAVQDAILEAKLSNEEIQDLHIFLGSTSMHISVNEEANDEFLKNDGKYKKETNGCEQQV